MFIKIGDIVQVAVPQPINSGLLTTRFPKSFRLEVLLKCQFLQKICRCSMGVGSTNLNRKK